MQEVLYLDEKEEQKLVIEKKKNIKVKGRDGLLIKFEGIEDADAARLISQRHLFRRSSSSPKLKKNVFWLDDIKGCDVFGPDEVLLGTVTDILSSASNDSLVVALSQDKDCSSDEKKEQMLIPFIEDYIDTIDNHKKTIRLKKIPEYI